MSTAFEIPEWLLQAPLPPTPVDDHRVEALVNRFIAGKQEALFTAPDAFYRLQGADAVQGQPAIADRLRALRAATLDLASDEGERAALEPRLDLHIDDASDGINRHVAEQHRVYQRQVLSQRQALIKRATELEHDNDDKIMGLAEANATAAGEQARMDGLAPDSPEAAAATLGARSNILRTAIDERIANRRGAQALALFDRVQDQLAPADRLSLDTPLQAARYEQVADQWIDRESKTDGPPLQQRLEADTNLPSKVKPIVRAKVDARDSADESARAAKVQGLDDEVRDAFRTLAINPRAYRPGTFARLADAYDAAGEPERAEFARRAAAQDAFIVPFTQASAEKQQRMIDEQPAGELRDSAIVTRDGQAQSFAHDAFAAGTAIYNEVGAPMPIDDIEGRIRQARQISQLRGGIVVVPFTLGEVDDIRRTLATGSEADKQAVRTRLASVPADMRPSIEPQEGPASSGSTQTFSVQAAPPVPAEASDEASANSPKGGQAGSPAVEPPPGSPQYQAAETEAHALDKPSYDDLGSWEKLKVEAKRYFLEGDSRGATYRADSAARRWQRVQELLNDPDIENNVVGKRYLLKNRNVAAELATSVGQLVEAQRKLGELPSSDALRQLFEAPSVAEAAKLLEEKGGKIASAAGFGSLPALTVGIVASAALGPIGGGIALTGSAGLEGYANGLIGALAQEGVDVTNPSELAAAVQDKDLMEVVRSKATTQGAIDAGVAALTAMVGIPGRAKLPAALRSGEHEAANITESQSAAVERQTAKVTASEKPAKLDRAAQLAANVIQGKAFEKRIREALDKMGVEYAEQVMIKAPNAPPVRIDFIVQYKGKIYLIEAKSSQTARLTSNQEVAFPELEKFGGVILGKGKPGKGFGGGMTIPATRVQVQTPKGAHYVSRPAGGGRTSVERWQDQSGRFDHIDGSANN